MQKKNIIIFIIALLLLSNLFTFIVARVGSGRQVKASSERIKQLEDDARNYGLTISGLSGRSQDLNQEVERLNGKIALLESEISESAGISREVADGLSGIDDGIGESRQRVQDAAGGVSGVEERLRKIIQEAEEEKSDNSG